MVRSFQAASQLLSSFIVDKKNEGPTKVSVQLNVGHRSVSKSR
jgi:hypothetical protein